MLNRIYLDYENDIIPEATNFLLVNFIAINFILSQGIKLILLNEIEYGEIKILKFNTLI